MGVYFMIFHGHHSNSMDKGIDVGISETAPKLQTSKVKQHKSGHKVYDRLGEAFMEYLWDEFDDEDDKFSKHKGEKAKNSIDTLVFPPYRY
ncbi:hypothetical protein PAXRUDRAFT_13220 [Paxillus rubicundulus Ve08.2h10]|uniref:Uncharacterized protein n=1 Tax=Paxillus rubicundulus Ve08.2h10 TaxID=930991 RepID=A0A0D0DU89_9AGAM|nr:hypothetical protein PAXRUDRAFT_13220 [Paxillus rubicundulus Ve08.2h10]